LLPSSANRRFQSHKRRQLFIGAHNETLSVGRLPSLTRKRVTPVLSVAHRQNVNAPPNIRRAARPPAPVHKVTTQHPLAVSDTVKTVSGRLPTTSKTQRSPQTTHVAGKSYLIRTAIEHLESNKLPVFSAFINLTYNQPQLSLSARHTGATCGLTKLRCRSTRCSHPRSRSQSTRRTIIGGEGWRDVRLRIFLRR